MSEHTPGPWKILKGGYIISESECSGERPMSIIGLTREVGAKRFANGYLIAAAPDMLEALEKVAEALPNGKWSFLPAVRAAITKAKAEG